MTNLSRLMRLRNEKFLDPVCGIERIELGRHRLERGVQARLKRTAYQASHQARSQERQHQQQSLDADMGECTVYRRCIACIFQKSKPILVNARM